MQLGSQLFSTAILIFHAIRSSTRQHMSYFQLEYNSHYIHHISVPVFLFARDMMIQKVPFRLPCLWTIT